MERQAVVIIQHHPERCVNNNEDGFNKKNEYIFGGRDITDLYKRNYKKEERTLKEEEQYKNKILEIVRSEIRKGELKKYNEECK